MLIIKQIVEKMNETIEMLLTQPVKSKPLKIPDLTLRDGQQCKLAMRVTKRAGNMVEPKDWERAVDELGTLAKTDEDILLGVLFPMQDKEFFLQGQQDKHRCSPLSFTIFLDISIPLLNFFLTN